MGELPQRCNRRAQLGRVLRDGAVIEVGRERDEPRRGEAIGQAGTRAAVGTMLVQVADLVTLIPFVLSGWVFLWLGVGLGGVGGLEFLGVPLDFLADLASFIRRPDRQVA